MFMFYTNRLLAISTSVVVMMIAFFLTGWIRMIGFYLTCWTGSYEELYRLLPESLHSG
jgi:hypothetical protein